jgi:tetratricopeptide (TPR) repeat protein
VMAVFGVPVVHEDDALRAVRAAADMRRLLARLNEEFERDYGVSIAVRMGINTGEVVAGDPATGGTFVTGEPVALAKRLEQAAGPGEILIGKATYPLVQDAVQAGPLRSFEVKGKRDPVGTVSIADVHAGAAGFRRRLDAPLVGRQRELDALRSAYETAVAGASCRLMTVLGPAGIGKSRLAKELADELGEDASTVTGRCLPYGDGITFWPVLEILRRLGGHESVGAILDGAEDTQRVVERLGALSGSGAPVSADELFWAIRRLLEGLASKRPLLVVLDDLHWAETTFLDLVEYLLGWVRGAPVLLVCLARADLLERRPTWSAPHPAHDLLVLDPLEEAAADTLLGGLGAAVDGATRKRILASAEGNPLYVEQMAALAAGGEVVVPPTIQALLAERLDRLNVDERAVLERAAIVGREFPQAAVADLCPAELRGEIGRHLLALARKELVQPHASAFGGEDAFRFRHGLIRDAAYEGMAKAGRAALHEQFAEWLEARAANLPPEIDEIVGYHLEQSFQLRAQLAVPDARARSIGERAADVLGRAGRRALGRGDMPAAGSLLARATELLPRDDRRRLALAPDLAAALFETGALERARELLAAALADAPAVGDPALEARVRIPYLVLQLRLEPAQRTDDVLREAERAIEIFTTQGDERGLAEAWLGMASVHWMASRWRERTYALEHALVHARAAHERRYETIALASLGLSLLWGPTPAPAATARCREIVDEAAGNRIVEGRMLAVLSGLHGMQGDFAEARALYERSKLVLDEIGLTPAAATHTLVLGTVELLARRPEAAEVELRAGCEALAAIGERPALATLTATLAEAVYAQGRLAEAERLAAASAEAGTADDVANETLWRTVRAKVLAERGELEDAVLLAREAVELASATDAPNLRGDAQLALAHVLQRAGLEHEAVGALEQAAANYTEKGNTVSAMRVAEALAAVAGASSA